MPFLQLLRNARWLTRWVLVWFALFMGTAIASPMLKPVTGQMVCTAMGGMKIVPDSGDGHTAAVQASLDCPLCAPMLTPPPPAALGFVRADARHHTLAVRASTHIAGLAGAALPARGPPRLN